MSLVYMNFKIVLKNLEKMGETNSKEFAEFTNIPLNNASVYLSRLYKMGLAIRRKDPRYNGREYLRKPYRYQVSKKGFKYLKYKETESTSNTFIQRYTKKHKKEETSYHQYQNIDRRLNDLEKRILKPDPEPEKKIMYITRNGYILYFTPMQLLEWLKFEAEQKIAEEEFEEMRRQRWEKKQLMPYNNSKENLVDWVIGEGSNIQVVKVPSRIIPLLVFSQNLKNKVDDLERLRKEFYQYREDFYQYREKVQHIIISCIKTVREIKMILANRLCFF